MNDTPPRLPLNRIALVLLLIAFAVIWFAPLGLRHLIPSDEGRYAEMAREMFVTGDWITPRYNGYKYFEKPPLQTWLNALTFAWFGVGEWQARLYTALASFAGVLLVGFTGARLFNPLSGFLAAVVLACSPYWNLMGHFNALDMGLAFWMALSLCALLLAQRPGLRPAAVRGWMWTCWAAMAFAVLSKGLVGLILPGAVLVLYTLIARDWALWKRLYLVSGLVIFFAIATPWFVLVQQRNPEFFNFFFIVQQFRRYLTPEQNRPGPFYYFVPVLLVGFLPWLSVAWQSIRHALRMPRQPNGFSPMLVLLIWSAFIFLFFSASHSKLISYVLPVAPALALMIGAYLPLMTAERFRRHLLGYLVFFVVAAFGIVFLARLGDARTPNALYRAFQVWLYAGLAVAAALTLAAAWLNRRAGVAAAIAMFGAAWLAFGTIGGTGHDEFGRYSSGALIAPAVRAELAKLPPDTPFYSVEMLDHTFPFYVGHTTIMVQRQDELAFGISVEPNKWIPTVDEWIARWKQDTHALAIMAPGQYDTLVKQGVPMRVIARDNRRVIVEKPQS
ncbi:glycosyltransferase family 39 protein [Burkholderia pseudomultivorans]|uniref:Undecaprenyl phosphate-alpha-4-amino-4-deoxy-L-arabinose arabinosyl transferase n=1 Tax=Burkholderia pseudomultivorans TaxID=1207504 RepID=A0ABU2E6U3_9BURK|nr:glycosyltransferase family 39 protein [Burkholderia pseudomultivorans]MDR8731846.1 Undecaprenyl phosphate-alpha-4-amino-4-deoxy-L-arabinose arabinosyl transferase [Burkholderia pseudomultivorans]MDR8733972.1 Undecaprenyl phosphate-alpha-4-amino-4-deoxy-L-arabinose arabinosyl transferase [Burkholderia pseudomultivorans]MDR8744136.1 Undecaprenyl phosphate-alpha-4-amino-4-deoxy-L-arabinose arabinosyl transferase [Burkholderia pseudomultivorans]MDR8755601.1 Undecaprenyl phosphate-alpha-4-amino-4